MSARQFLPTTTSSATFFRALRIASTTYSCPHTLRTLSSTSRSHQSSKRELYTVPAYQPHSFPDLPPPPRNTGIPDTSIAGPKPDYKEDRPASSQQHKKRPGELSEVASLSLPEGEAQKSRKVTPPETSTVSDSTTQSTSTDKSKPRRKFKPRKAAVTITSPAIHHLQDLLSSPTPQMIRIGVKNRGCSGLAYDLSYVEKAGKFDEVVEQDGVKVLIDSKALFSIIGSEMDWQEDKLSARFVFKNPNITEQCGCGESFSVS